MKTIATRTGHPDATMITVVGDGEPATYEDLVARPCMWVLAHRAQAVCTARRLVEASMRGWGLSEDTVDAAVLVVSELVTNAVEHALPPLCLRLERTGGGSIHIAVTDAGTASEEGSWTASCMPDEHGRGHGIIDLLTSDHGLTHDSLGTTRWADLPSS